jgi:hypothetical protein
VQNTPLIWSDWSLWSDPDRIWSAADRISNRIRWYESDRIWSHINTFVWLSKLWTQSKANSYPHSFVVQPESAIVRSTCWWNGVKPVPTACYSSSKKSSSVILGCLIIAGLKNSRESYWQCESVGHFTLCPNSYVQCDSSGANLLTVISGNRYNKYKPIQWVTLNCWSWLLFCWNIGKLLVAMTCVWRNSCHSIHIRLVLYTGQHMA